MPTRAVLPLACLLAAAAATPGLCGEPVYLKCAGEMRTVSVDPAKSTRTEEAFQRTYILKLGDAGFVVLERRGADQVWADHCASPAEAPACHVDASEIRLRRTRGVDDMEAWTIDRATGRMTIEQASKLSETGDPYEARQSFKGQCVTLAPDATPATPGDPAPASAARPPAR